MKTGAAGALRGLPGSVIPGLLALLLCAGAAGQERWFQLEMSIFTNEAPGYRDAERWNPDGQTLAYPEGTRRLGSLLDTLFIPALLPDPEPEPEQDPADSGLDATIASEPNGLNGPPLLQPQPTRDLRAARRERLLATGPYPPPEGTPWRFPDLEREGFLRLPAAASDFQQTNRALERSPDHRLLFHAVWRQPMPDEPGRQPLYVEGGRVYGDQSELQGHLSLYFNEPRDRVVVDADLWLSEFVVEPAAAVQARLDETLDGITALDETASDDRDSFLAPVTGVENSPPEWQLPAVPAGLRPPWQQQAEVPEEIAYRVSRVYRLRQAREMRSNEFYYLDHPALGMVITMQPYEPPELPEPELENETELAPGQPRPPQ